VFLLCVSLLLVALRSLLTLTIWLVRRRIS
jgi:hypothetical protein